MWRNSIAERVGPALARRRRKMGTLVSKRNTSRSVPPPPGNPTRSPSRPPSGESVAMGSSRARSSRVERAPSGERRSSVRPPSSSSQETRSPSRVSVRPPSIPPRGDSLHELQSLPPSSAAPKVPPPEPKRFSLPSKKALSRYALVLASLSAALIFFWPARARVVAASTGPAAEIVYATGTVEKENRIQIKVKPGGTVTHVYAQEGQVVSAGQVLARLENAKVSSDAKSARLQLEIAKRRNKNVGAGPSRASSLEMEKAQRDYENTKRLVASGTLAPNTLRDAELRLARVRAGYNAASGSERKESSADTVEQLEGVAKAAAQLESDLEIKAPFDGIVLQNLLKVGDFVAPGEPAIGFARNSEPIASVFVEEASVGRIVARQEDRPGSIGTVTVLALDRRTFQGEVIEIASEAERALRTFRVKVRFLENSPELRSGMSVEANLISKKHEGAVLVPTEALEQNTLWVLEGFRARQKSVKIGIRDYKLTEIESGIAPGAQIITRPEAALHDGMLIWPR